VRRDSDNTEQDVGFSGGVLDTAAMLAFCGAAGSAAPQPANGYASKWYDQSGAGNHAVQPARTSQYQVVNAGALVTQGGRPCLVYGGGSPTMALPGGMFAGLASSTALCVFSQAQGDAGWWIIGSSGLFTHTPYGDGAAYEQYLSTSRPGFPGYGSSSAPTVHAAQNDGTALSVFKNGVQAGSAQAAAFTNAPIRDGGRLPAWPGEPVRDDSDRRCAACGGPPGGRAQHGRVLWNNRRLTVARSGRAIGRRPDHGARQLASLLRDALNYGNVHPGAGATREMEHLWRGGRDGCAVCGLAWQLIAGSRSAAGRPTSLTALD